MTRLWTRGDRFWVESARPGQRWAWGRDEANRFWVAFGPHTAVSLEADEVPYWLGQLQGGTARAGVLNQFLASPAYQARIGVHN